MTQLKHISEEAKMTYKQWLKQGLKSLFSKEALHDINLEGVWLSSILITAIVVLSAYYSIWLLLLLILPIFTITDALYRQSQHNNSSK